MTLSPTSEHELVRQCLTGCDAAWARLFEYCHPTVVRQTSIWLGRQGGCGELAEEVAGRMWLKLVDSGYRRLALFDPTRGVRITTYLVAMAKQEFLQFQRERRRRVAREQRGAERLSHRLGHDSEVEILLNEYLEQLAAKSDVPLNSNSGIQKNGSGEASDIPMPIDPEKIRKLASLVSVYQKRRSDQPLTGGSKN